jgi:hypothetical protein
MKKMMSTTMVVMIMMTPDDDDADHDVADGSDDGHSMPTTLFP